MNGKRLSCSRRSFPGSRAWPSSWNPIDPAHAALTRVEAAAQALGVQLQRWKRGSPASSRPPSERASRSARERSPRPGDARVRRHRAQLAELATKSRLPTMYASGEFAEAGGLMSYGPSLADMFRRAATYVDKILKGAKPGRSARRAAHQVRAGHQPQDREGARPDDPAVAAAAGGSGHPVGH